MGNRSQPWRRGAVGPLSPVAFYLSHPRFTCLGFGFISRLPGISTADFVILALFFFARSSRRFEMWLRNHPVFGKIIRSYQGGLTVRAKTVALIAITASIGVSAVLLTSNTTLRVILVAAAALAWWYVLTRPGKDVGLENKRRGRDSVRSGRGSGPG